MNDIERAWEEAAISVESAQADIEEMTAQQQSDTDSAATFEESQAAEPPRPAESDATVHGSPDRPGETTFELSDSISERDVERNLDSVKERPPERPEQPEPFTEQQWFKLHSDQFPIGEEVFTEEALGPELEPVDEEPDTGAGERTDQPTRSGESEGDRESQ
jgi:hypothetical protein